jgi:hypothetical protein
MLKEKSPTAIAKRSEELARAIGLWASSKGMLVRSSGGKPTVLDGPFTETKERAIGGRGSLGG